MCDAYVANTPKLTRARLLTLLGPAGVGKTHLGLDVAHLLRSDFKDGVVFVALASSLRVKAQTPRPSNEQRTFEKMLAQARSVLTDECFTVAWRQGMMHTSEEAMLLALAQIDN